MPPTITSRLSAYEFGGMGDGWTHKLSVYTTFAFLNILGLLLSIDKSKKIDFIKNEGPIPRCCLWYWLQNLKLKQYSSSCWTCYQLPQKNVHSLTIPAPFLNSVMLG